VHGPWWYAGLNLPNLHTEQIIIQVLMVLKYGTQLADMTGILLQASMEDMTLKTGLQGDILDSWIKSIWLACQQYKIQIHSLPHDHDLPCINDIELTHLFLQHSYCANDLKVLNQCQMHLHAFWVSDICTGLGTKLNEFAWTGKGTCESAWHWLVTMRPSAGEWRFWQQSLTKVLSLD